ncbi:rhamnosyltransferase [Bacteroidia bacterium]|nr:rhamnosyltransferase [Bacteroidia bacterium]
MMKKRKVSIVGTNGIPAHYGGYETLADYLTQYLSDEFDFVVFCSKNNSRDLTNYNNAKLLHLPLKANGWQSLFYDTYTLFYSALYSDIILYLGPGAGFIVPIIKLFQKKIIVNHGGLNEWEREKYSKFQKNIAKLGHKYAAKFANINITDNNLLQKSILNAFGADSIVIRYGGDHAVKTIPTREIIEKYPFLEEEYYVNVSRAQVDNNLHIVLNAFKDIPEKRLVMVSNWNISLYGTELKKEYYNKYPNIILLDAVYEISEINAIRGCAKAYIHSHSYCGTSPSLVEAMCLGLPIFSYDVPTNRETTKGKAYFFKSSEDLKNSILDGGNSLKECSENMKVISENEYTWSKISAQYAELFRS